MWEWVLELVFWWSSLEAAGRAGVQGFLRLRNCLRGCAKDRSSLRMTDGERRYFAEAVVFFQDFAEAVVGQGDDFVVVDAFHGFGGDHGVDYGFFGGLDGREEDWVEGIVGEHGEVRWSASWC